MTDDPRGASPTGLEPLLMAEEVARVLKVSPSMVYKLRR